MSRSEILTCSSSLDLQFGDMHQGQYISFQKSFTELCQTRSHNFEL